MIPNLPVRPVSKLLVSCDADIRLFQPYCKCVVPSFRLNALLPPLNAHPDLQLVHIWKKQFVCEPSLFLAYQRLLPECEILPGKTTLGCNYPADTAYNIARVGKFAILNCRTADPVVKTLLARANLCLIDVRQGYAKCSVCVVDETSIITSDRGIGAAARRAGLDVLEILPGHIRLDGFDYGFIGGASLKLDKNTLAFYGAVERHPSFLEIKQFLMQRNIQYVSLGRRMLEDIGSAAIIS